jgi:hypothetical protein
MTTEAPNPSETHEERLPQGELERTVPRPVEPEVVGCSQATVIQTIVSLEDAALQSHRDGGITSYDLLAVVRAAEKARLALADGKTNPCRVVPDMVRDLMQGDLDEF